MGIKDRIRNKKNLDIFVQVKSDSYITEIFNRNKTAEKILSDAILNSKNIIITCGIDCDKSIIKTYIKHFDDGYELTLFNSGALGVFKQYEQCIAGKFGSISIINIKYFDNILNDLKLLMSIQCPTLPQEKIDEVLSVVNPIFVHFSKDEDGLFFIDNIAYVNIIDSNFNIENIYHFESEGSKTAKLLDKIYTKKEEEETFSGEETPVIQEYKTSEEIEQKNNSEEEENNDKEEPPQKVNRFKLLRDKFRFRKSKN